MSSDKFFVFYVMFDESKVPIFCKKVQDDPFVDDYFLYTGVEKLSDNVFPELEVNAISLPKKDVVYYVSGTRKELEKKIKQEKVAPLQKTKEPVPENGSGVAIIEESLKPKPRRRRKIRSE